MLWGRYELTTVEGAVEVPLTASRAYAAVHRGDLQSEAGAASQGSGLHFGASLNHDDGSEDLGASLLARGDRKRGARASLATVASGSEGDDWSAVWSEEREAELEEAAAAEEQVCSPVFVCVCVCVCPCARVHVCTL